jgi:hypothetical protein
MRFAMFCYASESRQWTNEMEDEVLERHHATEARLKAEGKIGPSLRLMPTTTALTIHAKPGAEPLVIDGPFAETKEALLGFWVFEVASLEEAVEIAREFSSHSPGGMLELRPVRESFSGAFG